MGGKAAIHVSLVAVEGTLAMPVAGLYEVLTAFPVVAPFNEDVPASPPFDVEIVGPARTTMSAASGLPITIQRAFAEIERTDIVIVPAMAVETGWDTGRHAELVDWMRRMHAGGAMLCSACTGLALLAETGLLDGRQATTHWAFAPEFHRCFPKVDLRVDEVLVTAGEREEFAMSGGAASWQDLVLYLIGRFVSPAAAQAIARFELLERHAEGQAPYLPFMPQREHGDALVLGLQQWLDENYSVASPVAEMTQQSGLSPRTMERRFRQATGHSPISYIQQVRVEAAKRRLERTDTPIDLIAWEVGYEDAAAFRRLFKRIARVTPGAYRKKFQVPNAARA
ncbi:helix-turn-helix domain-containing protein [Ectothiorhodospiraceae bacterium WFHF3C12]|nr:helix-turn-helix domain-containing protein [Ectothiorhodospiraceae bacterium WFHF3C12]